MSWISDLADKAETILNKLDQNTATALQNAQTSTTSTDSSSKDDVENHMEKISVFVSNGNKKNSSSSSLSLTPKKQLRNTPIGDGDSQIERQTKSLASSRRSSFSSKTDENIKPTDFGIERELAAFKIALAEVSSERDGLKEELERLLEENNRYENDRTIRDLEATVSHLVNERNNLSATLETTKSSNAANVKLITELEATLAKTRQEYLEMSERFALQVRESEQHKRELGQYRKKAQTTLQMKDNIINELKTEMERTGVNSGISENKILELELDNMKHENLNLQEELRKASSQLEILENNIQSRQNEIDIQLRDAGKVECSLRDALRSEQMKKSQLESDLNFLSHELAAVREQMGTQKHSFAVRLQEKESAIVKLQLEMQQTSPRTEKTSSENNFSDSRMQSLMDALVEKQAALEATTADRNALKLQFEKVQNELNQLLAQNIRTSRNQIINVNDTDDAKAQFPSLMRANPFDNRVARRVKRAYSTLDSAGIRLGVFLRRYPLIRILLFIYIAFLHIWVMFVLLSSSPF